MTNKRRPGRPRIHRDTMVIGVRLPVKVVKEIDTEVAQCERLIKTRSDLIREAIDGYFSRKAETRAT